MRPVPSKDRGHHRKSEKRNGEGGASSQAGEKEADEHPEDQIDRRDVRKGDHSGFKSRWRRSRSSRYRRQYGPGRPEGKMFLLPQLRIYFKTVCRIEVERVCQR